MSLEASVGLRKGTLDLGVELRVESRGVVVLLGPNAAGKTTLLRALAGLVPLETPVIETHLVPSGDAHGGIGEVGTPPIVPAVGNAIYALTGEPVRRLPIVRA